MTPSNLTDREAKDALLKWPRRIKRLWGIPSPHGYWIRAQPKEQGEPKGTPRISVPGARLFSTQPDAMWVFIDDFEYADVIAVEVSRTPQNLNDKRSRYAATVRSLVLTLPLAWLRHEVPVQRGGRSPRWEACRSISASPSADQVIPVRYLRVLFSLPNSIYPAWSLNNVADGHEFFCRHKSVGTYNSQKMQDFLRHMSPSSHFFTKK